MIELFFIVCLSGDPAHCEDRALQFIEVPLRQCQVGAQAQLARWAGDHPGWRIARWECRAPTLRTTET